MTRQRKRKKKQSEGYLKRFRTPENNLEIKAFDILAGALDEMLSFLPDDLRLNHGWFMQIFYKLEMLRQGADKKEYGELISYLVGKKDKFAGCKPTPHMVIRYLLTTEPEKGIAKHITRDFRAMKK
jgi:hypothetical protein